MTTTRWTKFSLFAVCVGALLSVSCGKKVDRVVSALNSPFIALGPNQNQILSIDLGRLRKLSIYADSRNAILDDADRAQWFESLVKDLGLDPLEQIDRVIIGFQGRWTLDDPLARAVIVCTGRFDNPDAMTEGFLKFVGERYLINPPPFTKGQYAGFPTYTTSAPSYSDAEKIIEYNFAFPSPNLMVFSRVAPPFKESLDILAGNAEGVSASEAWRPRFGQVDLTAVMWAVGSFPQALNQYLSDRVQSEPELAGLANLTAIRDFYTTLSVGREYMFRAALICDAIDRATGLGADLRSAREIVPRAVAALIGEDNPRVSVIEKLIDKVFISASVKTTSLMLRMDRRNVEEFVRSMIRPPPAPTPMAIPAPFLEEGARGDN